MIGNSNIVHVVLTGGVGSRLWPLSRKAKPKQYLDFFDGISLLEMTISRNKSMADRLVIVGNVENYAMSCKVMEKFSVAHSHIVEAAPRNTAAAIAFAAFQSKEDDILIVTPSDHIISGEEEYLSSLKRAFVIAENDSLVTFGIKPSKPETGYGYIEFEGENVLAFHEKPVLNKAEEFLEKGNFYWNSGLFCFKAGVFLQELQKLEPEVYNNAKLAWDSNDSGFLDYDLSMQIPSISIDYAVMERSSSIKVVASQFDWSDLGSFESVYDYLVKKGHKADANGNILIGSNVHTSFIGVENCLLVHTPDAFLVVKKEKSQEVKRVYQELETVNSPLL
ncbi:mannose-1-phosphate guanylyltransferase [Flavobacterium salmonis]|uniref:Mannose-1-phosphate guanylyltransferase n=1 Tax=Flavobacterium salmonis TaxID=2654844 RepID=A0A6V6Z4A6_9FLAO|nr:mannose-1-phosphate guanylyltransferase [Flavobacterium salmonis]CAD0006618.1 mannose-1-phosphate guanylyltransferase [Flavobacterium salmonis]